MRALFSSHCARCDEPVHRGDEIVLKRGQLAIGKGTVLLHARCASGQDDE